MRPPLINIILFLSTLITTVAAGALMADGNLLPEPLKIYRGLPFSLTLLTILGVHELGHYFVSKKRKVECSLPYFIPIPPPFSLLGTFGAFIKMKSTVTDRAVLIEIGLAGPLFGFLVAVLAVVIGLSYSEVRQAGPEVAQSLTFGSSLLFSGLTWLVLGVYTGSQEIIVLHPMAFAGWIGFLVTSLNLLPAGQLDGGHIIYALVGGRFRLMTRVVFVILLGLGYFWPGWFFWAGIILFFGFRHPPLLDEYSPLPWTHKALALIGGLIFLGTFVPVPFSL